jgi:hypothetical protein
VKPITRSFEHYLADSPNSGGHGRSNLNPAISSSKPIRKRLQWDWEKNMHSVKRILVLSLAAVLSTGLLIAQSFLGSITGTVQDTSGAVIPGAAVTLNSVSTGQQLNAVTNSAGIYLFSNLNPGVYTVTVSHAGFSQMSSSQITLIAAENTRFDAKLQVGTASQTIKVSTTPPALNTENGLLSSSLSTKAMLTMPMNRIDSTTEMLNLQSSTSSASYNPSIGGGHDTNINWSIDGVTGTSPLFGNNSGSMITPPYESIETLETDTSNSSAQYQDPSSVFISEKSGTNEFHGDVYDYETNWALNANSYFGTSTNKPKGVVRHIFGGTIGGPVILPHLYNGRDKTFFFFSYAGDKSPGGGVATSQEPTAAMMSGDFSQLLPSVVIEDPTTGLPFPGNIIPSSRISPVSQAMQKFGAVLPNHMSTFAQGYDWVGVEPGGGRDNQYSGRVDHVIGAKDHLFARVTFGKFPKFYQYQTNLPYSYYTEVRDDTNGMLGETHTFSPNLLNEFRLGFSRDAANYGESVYSNGVALTQQFGLQEPYLAQKAGLVGFPNVSYENFNGIASRGTNLWRGQTTQVLDNVSWMKGRNQFKFGIDYRDNFALENICCRYDFGQVNFDGFATGYDYADFLLGIPHTTNLQTRSPRNTVPVYKEIGIYALDDIQVTPKLTINLGLRWDYQTRVVDKNDQNYRVDMSNGNLILPNAHAQTLLSPVFVSSLPNIHYEIAPIDGFRANSMLDKQPNDWGPRFSFAYRPFGNDRSVVRGGYGIYYNPLAYSLMSEMGAGPYYSSQNFTNTITNGTPAFSFPAPFLATGGVGVQSVGTIVPSLPFPRSQQYNLSIEHEFPGSLVAELTYRGMETQRIPYEADYNRPHASTNPANASIYNLPQYSTVNYVQPGGSENLNALDASVTHRSGGLILHSSYTYGKNLSNVQSASEGDDYDIPDPYNLQREWGNVGWMTRQRSVSYFVYSLPFGQGQRFGSGVSSVVNEIVGGWETSGVLNFQTGEFLTPSFSGPDPSNTRLFGGRPDQIGDSHLSNPTHKLWFNPAAFAIPGCPASTPVCSSPADVGRFGTASNGSLTSPGLANFNFGLFKSFKIHERLNFRFGAEADNALNHPNFGNPNTNISSSNVGTITSMSAANGSGLGGTGSRSIELQGRLTF